MTENGNYPYDVGDHVMVGISTWESKDDKRSGEHTRYFVGAVVQANDRQAHRLVVEFDDESFKYDVFRFEDFAGGEIVPYDESLPMTARDAQARAREGKVY